MPYYPAAPLYLSSYLLDTTLVDPLSIRKSLQMPVHQCQRQSHDIEITAIDGIDKLGSQALNRVGPGLVHGFAARHIFVDFVLFDRNKMHAGRCAIDDHTARMAQ